MSDWRFQIYLRTPGIDTVDNTPMQKCHARSDLLRPMTYALTSL